MSVVHLMFFLFYLIFLKRFFFFWHLFSAIYQIQDKPTLFRSFYKWLKPGGKLLITDYCKSAGGPSSEFAEYIKKGGYYLHDMKAHEQVWLGVCAISGTIFLLFHPFGFSWYLHFFCMCILNHPQMLENAGFDDVIAEDRTDQVCLTLWSSLLGILLCSFYSSNNFIPWVV